MKRLLFSLVPLAFITACSDSPITKELTPAGKVAYTNARILTQDAKQPWAQTLIAENDRIIYVGTTASAQSLIDANTQVVNLENRFVMPGMIDTHTHPGLVGTLQLDDDLDLEEQQIPDGLSRSETVDWLKNYSDNNPWQPVVMLGEWDVNTFLPDGPTKEELDQAFTYRPALIMDNSGHSMWVNSAALKLLGVDEDTPDISPGISYFVRDENGEATGWVKEFALFPQLQDYMLPDRDELKAGILDYLTFLSEHGITTLWDAGNFAWDDEIYSIVAELDQENRLPVRYEGTFHIWDPAHLNTAADELLRLRKEYAGNRLTFNTLKIHYDGVAEIQTAGMLEPFVNTDGNHGGVLFTAEELAGLILELNTKNINLHLHVVGDRATREALNGIELAKQKTDINIELALSHLETVHPDDIPRFQQLNVHANFTPHWFGGTVFGEAGHTNLGDERASYQQVAKDFIRAGANVTLSSDVTSEAEAYRANPFIGLEMSVTRQEFGSSPDEPVTEPASARLTVADALSAYTINGARQMGLADSLGSLQAGKKADFLILDQNPLEVDSHQLHSLKPVATLVDGILTSGSLP